METIKFMSNTFKQLNIPFDKKFFNLPLSHYEALVEEIGYEKVMRHVRDVLMHYKDDKIMAEKARILSRKLKKKFLVEDTGEKSKGDSEGECECGYVILEESESCPVCGKMFYTGDGCFYKNEEDSSCSLDGEECKWKTRKECGKEV